jgi:hypothetical protein
MALYVYKKYKKQYSAWSSEQHTYYSVWGKGRQLPTYYGYGSKPSWNGDEYVASGTKEYRYTAYNPYKEELECGYRKSTYSGASMDGDYYEYWNDYDRYYRTRTVSKGDYIGEVIAEDGTYPNDGAHTDAYWYVKDRLAWIPPDIKFRIDSDLKTYEDGHVRINGALRQIDKIWVRIGGQLKES